MGILFVPNPSASLLDIPKLESVKLLENCIRNWSSAGYKAIFISRNLGTNQVDLFPFLTAPPVNPFTPSAVSPQKMYAAILNASEIGATGSPRMTLHPTPRLAKWYSRIYQGVVDQNLFSKPPSSLSVRTSTTPPESEDDGEARVDASKNRRCVTPKLGVLVEREHQGVQEDDQQDFVGMAYQGNGSVVSAVLETASFV